MNLFQIGAAKDIWDKKVNISETNLANALNQAIKRRAAAPLPDYEEAIYQAVLKKHPQPPKEFKSSDIKKADCDLMRDFLREEWESAEKSYEQWKPVDSAGKVL